MLTRDELVSLDIGDEVGLDPYLPTLCAEPLILVVVATGPTLVTFAATYFKVTLGQWQASYTEDTVTWLTSPTPMTGLYELADSLDTRLTLHAKTQKISGSSLHLFKQDGVSAPIHLTVVSSLITDNGAGVVVRMEGNLAAFVIAGFTPKLRAAIALLDLAKLGMPLENIVEKTGCTGLNDLMQLLKPGVVKIFHKTVNRNWKAASPT